jgi:hypothetical protein
MGETVRLTRIENMPEERRAFIENLMRQRPRRLNKIAALYNKQFPPEVTGEPDLDTSTVYSHYKLRVQEALDEVAEIKAHDAAMSELIGERGLDDAARAQQWETIQSMTPRQLTMLRTVELKAKELGLKEKEQDRKLKEYELREKQWNAERQKERKQVVDAIGGVESNEHIDAKAVRQKIRDIFGLADEPAEQNGAGAAVSGAVDQG